MTQQNKMNNQGDEINNYQLEKSFQFDISNSCLFNQNSFENFTMKKYTELSQQKNVDFFIELRQKALQEEQIYHENELKKMLEKNKISQKKYQWTSLQLEKWVNKEQEDLNKTKQEWENTQQKIVNKCIQGTVRDICFMRKIKNNNLNEEYYNNNLFCNKHKKFLCKSESENDIQVTWKNCKKNNFQQTLNYLKKYDSQQTFSKKNNNISQQLLNFQKQVVFNSISADLNDSNIFQNKIESLQQKNIFDSQNNNNNVYYNSVNYNSNNYNSINYNSINYNSINYNSINNNNDQFQYYTDVKNSNVQNISLNYNSQRNYIKGNYNIYIYIYIYNLLIRQLQK
ncbi:hypothetical protein IMG5_174200 [Ichthyophthirius multifiliis]|uniref:Uncharacterized protein n=1 Tax=Ichthyophthirius multifiliis TaxID=5932 RepID=G0R211_ICHMU|nr:hypothetical protein IMG5_174200 [Ichthyophthirius multifiliis]EGR28492.1 hypothetical protein IMG5_174200 [Ichthyophthirius multifiliis]|eukprot:XP_004029728.1 hypothetical protein IMG5_174200 [Ichthyophthirius multifiliis]